MGGCPPVRGQSFARNPPGPFSYDEVFPYSAGPLSSNGGWTSTASSLTVVSSGLVSTTTLGTNEQNTALSTVDFTKPFSLSIFVGYLPSADAGGQIQFAVGNLAGNHLALGVSIDAGLSPSSTCTITSRTPGGTTNSAAGQPIPDDGSPVEFNASYNGTTLAIVFNGVTIHTFLTPNMASLTTSGIFALMQALDTSDQVSLREVFVTGTTI